MQTVLISSAIMFSTLGMQNAVALTPARVPCTTRTVRFAVETMPLKDALRIFTRTTGCSVSLDTDKVDDMDAGDLTTTVIKGRYTPATALRLMLRNTPFKSSPIKGGYSIKQ